MTKDCENFFRNFLLHGSAENLPSYKECALNILMQSMQENKVITIGGNKYYLRPETYEKIRILKKENSKIEAIKLLREITGYGLKDSKDAVDCNINFPI